MQSRFRAMRIGLIGSGNMARAMARGWGEPVLCSDGGSGRASALVQELGGEVLSNRELAERTDLVVLCHKPYQLEAVAEEIRGIAKAVASVLGATTTAMLQAAYPGTPVFAVMPNTPVEIRRGVVIYAEPPAAPAGDPAPADPALEQRVLDLFGRLGAVVRLPETQLNAATALTGVTPAYYALLAEAQVDAGVRHGLKPDIASRLVAEAMGGSAALLAQRGYDTLAMRREVTSPGGSTARGLAALERAGIRTAFQSAIDAVVRPAQAGAPS
jgi:pyrroline-5-carboxylate reductase